MRLKEQGFEAPPAGKHMEYEQLLQEFTEKTKEIFAEKLTGIYLHGSWALGCFNPQKSDIDLILVTEKAPEDEQKRAFMDLVVRLNGQAPEKGLELSLVRREVCRPFVYPTPFELHFSNTHLDWYRRDPLDYIAKMKGTDKDLAAHFFIINCCGIVLYGAQVKEVFGEVPRADYLDSIWYDVGNAPEDILEAPMYITLNLCRALAYGESGLILSKAEGGQWGLEHLPERFGGLIGRALGCYGSAERMELMKEEEKRIAQEFGSYMAAEFRRYL